jgi:catechol 2,3-dioxygenase-like lactoylglutathione lyase family enzyme
VTTRPQYLGSDVRVRELPRSVRFYAALGLRPVARHTMRDGTRIVWLRDPSTGQLLELFELARRSPIYTPFPRRTRSGNAVIFGVRDTRRLLPSLRRFGGRPFAEFEDGEFRLNFLWDPDGTKVELVSWTDAARPKHRSAPSVRR